MDNSWLEGSTTFTFTWGRLWFLVWCSHIVIITRSLRPNDLSEELSKQWHPLTSSILCLFTTFFHIAVSFLVCVMTSDFPEGTAPNIQPQDVGYIIVSTLLVYALSYILTAQE